MQCITFDQLPQAIGQLQLKLEQIEQLILSSASSSKQEPDALLTIEEAAALLHLSKATLYGKVHNREVPFSKLSKRLYFSKAELMHWATSGRRKTHAEVTADAANYINSKGRR